MNPEPFLPPEPLLTRLRQLAAAAEAFAAQRSAADDDLARKRDLIHLRTRAARTAIEARAATQHQSADTLLATRLETLDARTRRRTEILHRAQHRARKTATERIEAEEGRRKFELQRDMLRATRERDAGLEQANATHTAFIARLDTLRADLDTLESQARDLLATHGGATRSALNHAGSQPTDGDLPHTPDAIADALQTSIDSTRDNLAVLRRQPLPALSRAWPVTLTLVLSPAILIPVLDALKLPHPGTVPLLTGSATLAALAAVLHLLGRQLARATVDRLLEGLGRCRQLAAAAAETATTTHASERQRLESAHADFTQRCDTAWHAVLAWLAENRESAPTRVDARAARAILRLQRLHAGARTRAGEETARTRASLDADTARCLADLDAEASRTGAALEASHAGILATLESDWSNTAGPVLRSLAAFRALAAGPGFTPDPLPAPGSPWTPPTTAATRLRFGGIDIDLPTLLRGVPPTPNLPAIPAGPFELPLLLDLPSAGSLILEAAQEQRATALDTLNLIITRALATSPPGRVSFTIFDPVGLGQGFAGFTHLADDAGHVIDGRIWTQPAQLEERLADLNEHLEKVIQMYLRNEFPTIAEYNEQAGTIAERFRFLVLADFPAGFTETALRRLLPIATSGARCGVFLLIHWNPQLPLPSDFPIATLRQAALTLSIPPQPRPILTRSGNLPGTRLHLDPAPSPAALSAFVQHIAIANRDSHRVEVPFDRIAPAPAEEWSLDTSAELRVPIGRTGATKLQHLALGKATRQHALIAGKTGSGKSTLFHVLITNLALWCSPDQVEFYLVDFKKGVEFKPYATHQLPHARVIAIESDREFGLSVLQRLDEELRRRGELFRTAQVQDLPGYRRSPGAIRMPRTLLLVDEFQEFFVEEDRIAQNASVLLDRIVRQGRAFGIHVVLGSQTLGGAYTVARSTLGQMVVRIALQCNEADALLIMDDDNPAPRLLSRPGEALYNDAAGSRAGNSPFQIVWLPDDVRDAHLRHLRQRASLLPSAPTPPLVFEGDAPANIRDNPALDRLLAAPSLPSSPMAPPRLWLGAPNSIKGPTEVPLHRRSGDNLLAIGQREDALDTLLGLALVTLATQHPGAHARFVLLDPSPARPSDPSPLERLAHLLPRDLTILRPGDLNPTLEDLAAELRERTSQAPNPLNPPRFILVHGLQHFRALRPDDEFAFPSADTPTRPATLFRDILTEGPAHGFHTLATCDTWNTVTRFLGRKLLSEFGIRVLLQMSANDSASLIDSPGASHLGLHRALLYLDREGSLEIFRPYAPPDPSWIAETRDHLARLQA